jgi:hypothetical protein
MKAATGKTVVTAHIFASLFATVMSSIQTRILVQALKKRTHFLSFLLALGTVIIVSTQIISSKNHKQ